MNLITTEKAVRLIELSNTLVINVDKRLNKKQIKKENLSQHTSEYLNHLPRNKQGFRYHLKYKYKY